MAIGAAKSDCRHQTFRTPSAVRTNYKTCVKRVVHHFPGEVESERQRDQQQLQPQANAREPAISRPWPDGFVHWPEVLLLAITPPR